MMKNYEDNIYNYYCYDPDRVRKRYRYKSIFYYSKTTCKN